jgi:hypothetical protein
LNDELKAVAIEAVAPDLRDFIDTIDPWSPRAGIKIIRLHFRTGAWIKRAKSLRWQAKVLYRAADIAADDEHHQRLGSQATQQPRPKRPKRAALLEPAPAAPETAAQRRRRLFNERMKKAIIR